MGKSEAKGAQLKDFSALRINAEIQTFLFLAKRKAIKSASFRWKLMYLHNKYDHLCLKHFPCVSRMKAIRKFCMRGGKFFLLSLWRSEN
jgi:hypothetical protein